MNRFVLLGLVLSLSCIVEPISAQVPQINPGGAVNGASFASGGALAPGVIFSIFGTNLTDGNTETASSTPLLTRLAGARVLINGVAAPCALHRRAVSGRELDAASAPADAAKGPLRPYDP